MFVKSIDMSVASGLLYSAFKCSQHDRNGRDNAGRDAVCDACISDGSAYIRGASSGASIEYEFDCKMKCHINAVIGAGAVTDLIRFVL